VAESNNDNFRNVGRRQYFYYPSPPIQIKNKETSNNSSLVRHCHPPLYAPLRRCCLLLAALLMTSELFTCHCSLFARLVVNTQRYLGCRLKPGRQSRKESK